MSHTLSDAVFNRSKAVIPGGVNSPVRAFGSVGGIPPVIARGKGSHVWDVDGNEYIDYVCSWGPLILGHACEEVVQAVVRAAQNGTSFGAPTEAECHFAELVASAHPAVDKVRLVSSGTEATMSALRLARAWTKRDLIVKFAGGYHGHGDSLLAAAGSGLMTLSIPSTPGVPRAVAEITAVLPYNDEAALEEFTGKRGGEIAAIIVEPVAANMGVIEPLPGFLEALRRTTRAIGALLIFDEVITGFRLALGGASEKYGIVPDLVALGKIIGGGLPVGAYGGRSEIMDMVAPVGNVYQAGTLSGNPLATAAGIATIKALKRPGVYEQIESKAAALENGLRCATADRVPVFFSRVGSLMTPFFHDGSVRDFNDASECDTKTFARFFHGMLERGIYLAPSQFEAAFVSLAHSDEDITRTVAAAVEVMASL